MKFMAQFGIIHGGVHEDLRSLINETTQFHFRGYALGGLAVGESHMKMMKWLLYAPQLPENKIRYLMGVGRPIDIVEAVYRGVDIFDCVIPTREGRHGLAYIGNKSINLRTLNLKMILHWMKKVNILFQVNILKAI